MSEESGKPVPHQGGPAEPKGLLQQMEELMAALSADLNALDADLQATATEGGGAGEYGRAGDNGRGERGVGAGGG
ncbi:hypothetical protein ABZX40_22600 [Streptomyces sp. NPDC004610]|uniref:hypothetical protein n=1 Tax=unclassified Streptomyces TaxID=2593676 RepID=UPI0033AA465D